MKIPSKASIVINSNGTISGGYYTIGNGGGGVSADKTTNKDSCHNKGDCTDTTNEIRCDNSGKCPKLVTSGGYNDTVATARTRPANVMNCSCGPELNKYRCVDL